LFSVLLTTDNPNQIRDLRSLLWKFANNVAFLESMASEACLLEYYGAGSSKRPPMNDIVFEFLRYCMVKHGAPTFGPAFYDLLMLNFESPLVSHLCLAACVFRTYPTAPDFARFNAQVRALEDCSCYEDLLAGRHSTAARTAFVGLCESPSKNLAGSLLLLAAGIDCLDDLVPKLLPSSKFLPAEKQILVLQKLSLRASFVRAVFPPWKTGFDGSTLLTFFMKNGIDATRASSILQAIFAAPAGEITWAFSSYPMFAQLVGFFCTMANDRTLLRGPAGILTDIACQGTLDAFDLLIDISALLAPGCISGRLLPKVPRLFGTPGFAKRLRRLFDVPEFIESLSTSDGPREIVQFLVSSGDTEGLRALTKGGPYELVDRTIVDCFSGSQLAKRPPADLDLLARGQKAGGTIRIPSLFLYIEKPSLETLLERSQVGEYLGKLGLLPITHPLFDVTGVVCLSAKQAVDLVGRPEQLLALTDPRYCHANAYQFERGKTAYLSVMQGDFTATYIADRVPPGQTVTLFESWVLTVTVENGGELVFGSYRQPLPVSGPLEIIARRTPTGTEIKVGGRVCVSPPCEAFAIGSRRSVQGATFYVKAPLPTREVIGVQVVTYHGFMYHLTRTGVLSHIFNEMLAATDATRLRQYFTVLVNCRPHIENFVEYAGFVRQIILRKISFLGPDLLQTVFKLVQREKKVDWLVFRDIFIDYELWTSVPELLAGGLMPLISKALVDDPPNDDERCSLSIVHFFFDLAIHLKLPVTSATIVIAQCIPRCSSALASLGLYVFHDQHHPIVVNLLKLSPDVLGLIPLKFVRYLPEVHFFRALEHFTAETFARKDLNTGQLQMLLPVLQHFVTREAVWKAVLSIGIGTRLADLRACNPKLTLKPGVIPVLVELLCSLYAQPNAEPLLGQVLNIVSPLILPSKFVPPLADLRTLLHFKVRTNKLVMHPVDFGDNISAGRKPLPIVEKTIPTEEAFHYRALAVANDFVNVKDVLFGCLSSGLAKDIDEGASTLIQGKADVPNATLNPAKSVPYKLVLEMCVKCLLQLKHADLTRALQELSIFGANVDPTLSLTIHRELLLSFIRASPPTTETLRFLHIVAVVGWWDGHTVELFNALCSAFAGLDTDDPERWKAFGDLIECLLVLSPDYSKLRLSSVCDVVFHARLLTYQHYFLFIFHVLLSDLFQKLKAEEIRTIWLGFLGKILPGSLEGLVDASSASLAQLVLEKAATDTNYFTKSSPEHDPIKEQLLNGTRQSFEVFVTVRRQLGVPFREKIKDLRTLYIVNPQMEVLTESKALLSRILVRMDELAFRYRVNVLSIRNERSGLRFWNYLPRPLPSAFQIAPQPGWLSVPSLLVPFLSSISYEDFPAYGAPRKFRGTIPGTVRAEIPRCLPASASQSYYPDLSMRVFHDLLLSHTTDFGANSQFHEIHLTFGPTIIACVLIVAERGQYILTDAVIQQGVIVLERVADDTVLNVLLDACVAGYYGDCNLFFGHVLLRFATSEILTVALKIYHVVHSAIEIWLLRGTSLFLVFLDDDVANAVFSRWRASITIPSVSEYASPLSRLRMSPLDDVQKLWVAGRIPSLYYLLALNQFSSRSFAVTSQYPVIPWVIGRDFTKLMSSVYSTAGIVNRFLNSIEPHSAFSVLLRVPKVPLNLTREASSGQCEPVPEVFTLLDLIVDAGPRFWQLSANMRQSLEATNDIRAWIDLVFGIKAGDSSSGSLLPTQIFTEEHPERRTAPIPPLWQGSYLFQPLIKFDLPKTPFFITSNELGYSVVSPGIRFEELGGLQESFDCCALSRDELFFAGFLGIGIVKLFAFSGNFYPIGDGFAPLELQGRIEPPFRSCAVSSHLNVVLGAAGDLLLAFHIASARFIREIQSRAPVCWALIADLPEVIFAVGVQHIDVFTLNGKKVATQSGIGPISACATTSGSEAVVVVGTPAGAVFWTVNFGGGSLVRAKLIDFGMEKMIGLGIFDLGSELVAVDDTGAAKLCVVPRSGRCIKKKQVAGCAACGKTTKYVICTSCGLAYCHGCMAKQADNTCLNCFIP
jgi:hypothetical protein